MRSDFQDPFQKEFLISASSCQQASSHPASLLPAIWLARDLRASELASSHQASSLAGNPASSRVAGARDLRAGCLSPSNGLPSLSFKAIQLLKKLIPN
ncbi:UNVERIFIED_CONTAM: hypothetical protein Sradi_7201900 [Sesamum radiatum]|uniref:Uncharacterized protein n=1 Tax=Sesamum radiatum TaxID=300843 RepID=A0AAW2IRR9_SESRA